MCNMLQGVTLCRRTLLHSAQRLFSLPAGSTSPHHQPPLCASPQPPVTNLLSVLALNHPSRAPSRPTHSPLQSGPQVHPSRLRAATRSHQDMSLPCRKVAKRALDLQPEDCTHVLVLTSTQTRVLSVKRGMTTPISQICFRTQMSLCPVSCSNFLCTTATCLILPSNSTSSP